MSICCGRLVGALLLSLPLWAQAALPLTPFEQAPTRPLPHSTQISSYLHLLAHQSRLATVTALGTSAGGRPVEALLVSEDPAFLQSGKPDGDRLTVMLLGSQHGNEPSGTEVLQIIARRVLDGELTPLLQKMNFVIVALANPDGRDLNRRLNAKDENPNLDFIAVESPETRIYIDALARFQPDVVMDLHETWNDKWPMTPREGFLTTTDAQFEVGNNPNLDAQLSQYANHAFLPALIEAVQAQGIPSQRYNEIYSLHDPVRRGGLSLSNFRNYAAMQGSLTVLFENRHDGAGTFPTPENIAERVRKQRISVEEALALVARDDSQIRHLSREARFRWRGVEGDDKFVMQYAFAPNPTEPTTAVTLADRTGKRVVKTFRREDYVALQGTGAIPEGYVIRAQTNRFREWLDRHHIDYQVVSQPEKVELTQQRVASMKIGAQTKPGTRDWLDVTLDEKVVQTNLQPGDLLISTEQPQGALISIMLDPRSANSLYQEPTWRALLMSNPLPTAPLLADSADLAKREAAKGNKARLAKDNKAAKPSQPAG